MDVFPPVLLALKLQPSSNTVGSWGRAGVAAHPVLPGAAQGAEAREPEATALEEAVIIP